MIFRRQFLLKAPAERRSGSTGLIFFSMRHSICAATRQHFPGQHNLSCASCTELCAMRMVQCRFCRFFLFFGIDGYVEVWEERMLNMKSFTDGVDRLVPNAPK